MSSTADFIATRLFTVAEVNALIPRLREIFDRARPLIEKAQALHQQLVDAGHEPEALTEVQRDPSAPREVQEAQVTLQRTVRELYGMLRDVAELGAEIKAPDGLVDFRSRFHGRVVYLCWKHPEAEVTQFHELNTGFAGRQPIDDPEQFTGELLH
jgi:hypothetical protein